MGRSIGAVLLGFLYALASIMLAVMILWFCFADAGEPGEDGTKSVPESLLVLRVVCVFAGAVLAGFMTAHIARRAELAHGLALGAVLVVVLAITTLVIDPDPTPSWYQLALPAVSLPGALLGAQLRTLVKRPPPPAPTSP